MRADRVRSGSYESERRSLNARRSFTPKSGRRTKTVIMWRSDTALKFKLAITNCMQFNTLLQRCQQKFYGSSNFLEEPL